MNNSTTITFPELPIKSDNAFKQCSDNIASNLLITLTATHDLYLTGVITIAEFISCVSGKIIKSHFGEPAVHDIIDIGLGIAKYTLRAPFIYNDLNTNLLLTKAYTGA